MDALEVAYQDLAPLLKKHPSTIGRWVAEGSHNLKPARPVPGTNQKRARVEEDDFPPAIWRRLQAVGSPDPGAAPARKTLPRRAAPKPHQASGRPQLSVMADRQERAVPSSLSLEEGPDLRDEVARLAAAVAAVDAQLALLTQTPSPSEPELRRRHERQMAILDLLRLGVDERSEAIIWELLRRDAHAPQLPG